MKIIRVDDRTTSFELTEKENAAINEAKLIVKQRAKDEGGDYDEQMLEWWLYGILRERGIDGMIKQAKEAPFRKKYTIRVGYSY